MEGFSGEMQVVTLGKGLVKLTELDGTVDALMEDKSTMKVSRKALGYGDAIKVIIHSEDDNGKDISIICNPNQIFKLINGYECKAMNLQGERLMSIGVNKVYCTKIMPYHMFVPLYKVTKAEVTGRDFVYINGIRVKI